MTDFNVDVQNVEGNEENISITGVVNGVQVAAVIKTRAIPSGLSKKKYDELLAGHLVDAFEARVATPAGSGGIKVSRE